MKVIVIEEESHGDIKVCADMRLAFQYLIEGGWLTVFKPIDEALTDLVSEYERDKNFLNGNFYFHEIEVYKGNK